MAQTSDGRPGPGQVEDPLALLDDIAETPLADQVVVFDAIHAHLSDRLTSAES